MSKLKKDWCDIVFDFCKDNEKSIMVYKKSKTIRKVFFIPKSIVIDRDEYEITKSLWKDCHYKKHRIKLRLPKWYCDKELGFYR